MASQIGTEVEEFVEGWDFIQTLGEGAYGEVKLVINRSTQEAVAVKIIDLSKYPDASTDIRKEVCIIFINIFCNNGTRLCFIIR